MRKKSSKTDRHINVEDDYSDYDSPGSNHEIDVKEALRSSISLKTKYQPNNTTAAAYHHLQTPSSLSGRAPMTSSSVYADYKVNHRMRHDDEMSTMSSDSLDVGMSVIMAPKKEKKSKKPEDQETAAMRRERNRLAAQRCRQRRRDRIDKLEKICDKLENDGDKLETEITDLQKEMSHLQKILTNHKCMATPHRPSKPENSYAYTKYDHRIISS